MYINRNSHRRCSVKKSTGKQLCQSASIFTNELQHVYMLKKLATFIQAKLSFSYYRQVNLRKSKKMVKRNPKGRDTFAVNCCTTRCTTRCHSLPLVVRLVCIFIKDPQVVSIKTFYQVNVLLFLLFPFF